MTRLIEVFSANLGSIIGMLLFALAFIGALRWVASRYLKASPSTAIIKYGRKHKVKIPQADGNVKTEEIGFLPVVGGGTILWPFFESYTQLNLGQRTIPFEVANLPTKDRVPVNVSAVALVHISSEMEHLIAAAQKYEDMKDEEINETLKTVLEGQLRAILGKMTVEDLINDRDKLAMAVFEIAEKEMGRLGIKIDSLNILNIKDDKGYIENLGVQRIAEVKRDADIARAEAEQTSAERVAAADRAGKQAKMQAEAEIALADRDLKKKKADYQAEVAAAEARAAQAGPLAQAEAERGVKLAQVAVQTSETEARVKLAQQEKIHNEAHLAATVLATAEATRQAAVITAEGTAQAQKRTMVIGAEAAFEAAAKQADATRIGAEAEAAAAAAKGKGEAEATQAKGLADAKAAEAKGLAEATSKMKLAEALAKLDDTGRLLQVLEAAPRIAEAVGDALAKALGKEGAAQIFAAIAAPMGEIDSINIVDLGGSKDGSPIDKLPNTVLNTFFNLMAQSKALGVDLRQLANKIGLDIPDLLQNVGASTGKPSAPSA